MTYANQIRGARDYVAMGYQMIESIDVRNFRCFPQLEQPCSRFNIIVGDNGTGKTSVLESIFFPLASSTDIAPRLRQQRGLEGNFQGSPSMIQDAIFADFFTNRDMSRPISLTLKGTGIENRSVEIARLGGGSTMLGVDSGIPDAVSAQIGFTYRNHHGQMFGPLVPTINAQGVSFPSTGEDADTGFFFFANQMVSSIENATRFSDLSKKSRHRQFVDTFTKEYDWISDIAVEVFAGAPVLFATVVDSQEKIPVPNISSGINRVMGITLAMAARPGTVLLIDEIENGIYFKHMKSVWRQVLSFAREYDCQMFISTHSQECLRALVGTTDDLSDVSLWQLSRRGREHTVTQATGDQLRAALDYDEEVR